MLVYASLCVWVPRVEGDRVEGNEKQNFLFPFVPRAAGMHRLHEGRGLKSRVWKGTMEGEQEVGNRRAYLLGRVSSHGACSLLSFALNLCSHGRLLLGSGLLLGNTGWLASFGGGGLGSSLSSCICFRLSLLGGRFGGCSLLNLGEHTRLGVAGGCASLSGHCYLFYY